MHSWLQGQHGSGCWKLEPAAVYMQLRGLGLEAHVSQATVGSQGRALGSEGQHQGVAKAESSAVGTGAGRKGPGHLWAHS